MLLYFEYVENAKTIQIFGVWRIEYLETSGNPRENINKLVPKDSDDSREEYLPKVAKKAKKCLRNLTHEMQTTGWLDMKMTLKRSQIWQGDSGDAGLGFWRNPNVFKP